MQTIEITPKIMESDNKVSRIEIQCKYCLNKQEYTLRDPKNIPDRPKTVCTQCGKWIYIDKEILPENIPKKINREIEIKELNNFFNEFNQLTEFVIAYLQNKYEPFHNLSAKEILISIENKIDSLINLENNHILEKNLQRLLRSFPQIIEPNLKFIQEEYNIGDTLYRGDLLFKDSENRLLYIELKIIIPNYDNFETQLKRYLSHISEKDRLMYIAPDLTPEQESFCDENNIEIKIINLNEIFK